MKQSRNRKAQKSSRKSFYQVAFTPPSSVHYYREIYQGFRNFCVQEPRIQPVRMQASHYISPEALEYNHWDAAIGMIYPSYQTQAPYNRNLWVNISGRSRQHWTPSVLTDDLEVGALAASTLAVKPVRSFACLANARIWHAWARCLGFRRRLKKLGHPSRFFCLEYMDVSQTHDSQAYLDHIKQQLRDWLLELPRPSALFCAEDTLAVQIIDIALQLDLSIPDDLMILGCNNATDCQESSPLPFSSVQLSGKRVGYVASQHLFQLLRGKQAPPLTLIPPEEVVERLSTGRMVKPDNPRVRKALQILETSFRQSISIDALARECGMSRRLLELRFRETMHTSPYDHLLNIRLNRAKECLTTTPHPIGWVAEESGFGDIRTLGIYFRRKLGISPMNYRKMMRKSL